MGHRLQGREQEALRGHTHQPEARQARDDRDQSRKDHAAQAANAQATRQPCRAPKRPQERQLQMS